MKREQLIVLLFLFLPVTHLFSQEADSVPQKKNFLQRMDSINNWKIERGRSTLTPFAAPSYTPETSFMLTAGGLYTFKISPDDKLLSRSTIPFSVGYSTNGSLLISIRANIYGLSDKLRITGEYWNKNMPDNYWGVGYDKGLNTPESDSTTAYQRNWKQFKFKIAYMVAKDFFVGLNYDNNNTEATEVNPVMAADSNYMLHGSEVYNKGFGLVLRYDSRDFPENAYNGMLFEFAGTNYGRLSKESNDFQVYELDYRQYRQVRRKGSTLAWQVKARTSLEDVPWTELSMVGTPFDLRGYTWGRYRDYSSLFMITEYRHMFTRNTPNSRGDLYGPFGFVVWAGAGSIAESMGELTDWLPNAGVGLRFEVVKRMNLRIDYGIGKNSKGFYFSFNEAF
ncbi:MAG: hypothetical protein IH598_06545 [Bacteroidales bacterium]|nr:hypothetical protein [Bacteroidales bacterium]